MVTKHISASYAAGFFDGEGTVSYRCVHRKHSRIPPEKRSRTSNGCSYYEWIIRLAITNTNPKPLFALKARWGGAFRRQNPGTRAKTNRKRLYQWIIVGKQAERFARDILTFAIVKRRQIRLFLDFRSTLNKPGEHGISKSVLRKRLVIGEQIHALNARGIRPVRPTPLIRNLIPTWVKSV